MPASYYCINDRGSLSLGVFNSFAVPPVGPKGCKRAELLARSGVVERRVRVHG